MNDQQWESDDLNLPPTGNEDGDGGGNGKPSRSLVASGTPPTRLHVFPLDDPRLFPGMALPVAAFEEGEQNTLQQAASQNNKFLGFIGKMPADSEPAGDQPGSTPTPLYRVGVVARIERMGRSADGALRALVRVGRRFEVTQWRAADKSLVAIVSYPEETFGDAMRTKALFEKTRETLLELLRLLPGATEQLGLPFNEVSESAQLADFVAASFEMKAHERQRILEAFDVTQRLELALQFLLGELEVRRLGARIQSEIKEKLEKRQREYFLREQLSAIKRELGEEKDEKTLTEERYEARIEEAGMPEEAENKARKELERLKLLTPEAAEYNVIRNYLDVFVDLPWSRRTEDQLDVARARQVLDADHYGLQRVKDRILEYLAVQKLTRERQERKGPVLCLSGPPGVGKTSLGRSIARAMGRKFYRFSLGGMRDEAEIKGHRRTYIGAMPGKILQAMSRAGTKNPVIMLDEIDKLGKDWRGDPSSAMLEVLDPEQNNSFLDHYIDVPYDLSEVFFICTSNVKEHIPGPLLDRMEVIDLTGYIDQEKVEIARRHLVPKQREAHALDGRELAFTREGLLEVVRHYTMEAGVRNLERSIAAICRKTAARLAEGDEHRVRLTQKNVAEFLGPHKFKRDQSLRLERPGVALGLAWTPFGGDTLFIETARMEGRGNLTLTGQLGEVMSESARIALSYIRAHAGQLDVDLAQTRQSDFHIHFPAGAIPKDGPSAGITITTALLSLFTGRCVRPDVAMTGEITLTGKVLPVGGIREKVLAAHRHGIKEVILPRANEEDLGEVPEEIRRQLTFHPVAYFEEAIPHALKPTQDPVCDAEHAPQPEASVHVHASEE